MIFQIKYDVDYNELVALAERALYLKRDISTKERFMGTARWFLHCDGVLFFELDTSRFTAENRQKAITLIDKWFPEME